MNREGRSVGRLFVLRDASSLDDASSRSFNKRLALSPVDASNRPRRVTLRAEAAAISINILAAMVLKFGLADLRVRNRVSALELEVGVRRFLPQGALVRAGHAAAAPERVGPGADGRGAEEGRRARQVRGRPGRGAAAHLRQRSDEARVDGRHRACVVRRRFSSRRWRLGAVSGRAAALAAAICGRLPRVARWLCARAGRPRAHFAVAWSCTDRERPRDAVSAPKWPSKEPGAASQSLLCLLVSYGR